MTQATAPDPTDAATNPSVQVRRSLPYMPGLDGLRAFSVLAVLLYHADVRWIPGGFLGVEVFFVISGYLITSLLLAEWHDEKTVDLRRFWMRRARRLLPALYALLAAVVVFAAIRLPHELAGLKGDVLAALAYVTNWYLIVQQESYFEIMGRPSLLKHLWSLAVEEQFYIFWPILVAVGMRVLHRRGFMIATLLGVLGSTALMWYLFVPGDDPSRVYYGTDTRAAGLLLGSLLAFLWNPWQLPKHLTRVKTMAVDLAGVLTMAGVTAFVLVMSDDSDFLYQGGFFVLGLATIALIAAAVHPAGHVGRALGIAPLRWAGQRSYAIYLWHWPVFLLTRPWVDIALEGPALLAYRLALTFVLAEVSYRVVEQPLRYGSPRGLMRAVTTVETWWSPTRRLLREMTVVAPLVALVALMGLPLVGLSPLAIVRASTEAEETRQDLEAMSARAAAEATQAAVAMRSEPQSTTSTALAAGAGATGQDVGTTGQGVGTTGQGVGTTGQGVGTDTSAVVGARATPIATATAMPPPPRSLAATARAAVLLGTMQPASPATATAFAHLLAGSIPDTATAMVGSVGEGTPAPGTPALPRALLVMTQRAPRRTPVPFGEGQAALTSTLNATFIGDSVMLGAAPVLQKVFGPTARVDATISRQFGAGVFLMNDLKLAGLLGDVMVIHLGNNGNLNSVQFDDMMHELREVPLVLLLTVKIPRRWEPTVNEALASGVERWHNAELLDWRSASLRRPELFMEDGIHLLPTGREFYARLILDSIDEHYDGGTGPGAPRRGAEPPVPRGR